MDWSKQYDIDFSAAAGIGKEFRDPPELSPEDIGEAIASGELTLEQLIGKVDMNRLITSMDYLKAGLLSLSQGGLTDIDEISDSALSQAKAYFDAALRLDPTFEKVKMIRGFVFYRQENYDSAISDFTSIVNSGKAPDHLMELLGDAHLQRYKSQEGWVHDTKDLQSAFHYGNVAAKTEVLDELEVRAEILRMEGDIQCAKTHYALIFDLTRENINFSAYRNKAIRKLKSFN